VVMSILYRLKTGYQWIQLPVKEFFKIKYSWQSVYYNFQTWSKNGSWEQVWRNILEQHKSLLDMSSIQLDGTHTPAKRGGKSVAYQGIKKCKTTNALILTDSQGILLACSDPIAGNHNDAYHLVGIFDNMAVTVQYSNIATNGLFLNANSGFVVSEFPSYYYDKEIFGNIDYNKRNGYECQTVFDELLYKTRFVIERTNAWLDAFKARLVRFETNDLNGKGLILLLFSAILLRKL